MLNQKEFSMLYETVLASPGMSDHVKIGLNLPRKLVLVLSKIIDAGITAKGDKEKGGLLALVDEEIFKELSEVNDELLQKAGLKELNEKIYSLMTK